MVDLATERNLSMKQYPTMLRCYARPEASHYIGHCLELDLAVRGNSLVEVRQKMEECLTSYLQSLDTENVGDLFPRSAPLHVWLDYYRVYLLIRSARFLDRAQENFQVFREQVVPQRLAIHPIG